jgi:hypothetical protein
MKNHIESIPKIESHYSRAHSTRTFIDGSKTITDIYRDYVRLSKEDDVSFSNYTYFYNIFTKEEYKISFFIPKKDQCELCTVFHNSDENEKQLLQQKYDLHHHEKVLSRIEKESDKAKNGTLVAVYDLQAVMQLPNFRC